MGALMRSMDWSKTPVGEVSSWPQSLKTTVNMLLNSKFGMFLWWGPDLVQFYNDAYRPSFGSEGEKHPQAMGQKGKDCWQEIWHIIYPQIEQVLNQAIPSWNENQLVPIFRNGILEEVYWTYSYSPVFNDEGEVGGVLVVVAETTREVISRRRSQFLAKLSTSLSGITEKEKAIEVLKPTFFKSADIPAFLLYLKSDNGNTLQLRCKSPGDLKDHLPLSTDVPMEIKIEELAKLVLQSSSPEIFPLVGKKFDRKSGHTRLSQRVYAVPILQQGSDEPDGVLVFALNPMLLFDDLYKTFLNSATAEIVHSLEKCRSAEKKKRNKQELERVRSEAEKALVESSLRLQQQKRMYDSITSSTPDMVYVLDTNYRFIYANQAIIDMWGISPDNYMGKQLHELGYEPWQVERHHKEVDEVVRTKETLRREVGFNHAALGKRMYDYIFAPIFDDDENVVAIAGTARDITEVKRLEEQKDQFIAVASHELKTPITSLKVYTQILQSKFEDQQDELAAKFMEKMDAQINKLTSLVNDLLDITKMKGGKLQFNFHHFELNELIREVAEEIQRTTKKHKLKLDLSGPAFVCADRDRIGQVLINYLTNAIKYSPKSDVIKIRGRISDGHIIASVEDFGLGIPAEKKSKIFQQFYRVDGEIRESLPGLGIGLFISKEIIQRHDGSVWFESDEDKGSVFYFKLPLAEEKSGAAKI